MYNILKFCARIRDLCPYRTIVQKRPTGILEPTYAVSAWEAIDASSEACLLHEARQYRQTI